MKKVTEISSDGSGRGVGAGGGSGGGNGVWRSDYASAIRAQDALIDALAVVIDLRAGLLQQGIES